jgi:multidrug efflux pump subunit AcrA (membrane-fusion protein)
MTFSSYKSPVPIGWFWLVIILIIPCASIFTFNQWWPTTQTWVQKTIAAQRKNSSVDEHEQNANEHEGHGHAEHEHAHSDANSLELSEQALGNIGLTKDFLKPVELQNFIRTIIVPGIVVERPGRTTIEVSTPMAGLVTHVHAVQGEAIKAGSLLFEIRITAEELVATQTELLKSVGELDVENREIIRLEEVTKSGAVAQKSVLERQYAKEKIEVLIAAQKEALRLQGLSDRQISDIVKYRRLLRDLQIIAPVPDRHSEEELKLTSNQLFPVAYVKDDGPTHLNPPISSASGSQVPLILQQVLVHKGQTVPSGTTLAIISDMSELYVEGQAFEQDAELLVEAAKKGWKVTGLIERSGQRIEEILDLELLYSANEIEKTSRILRFYVRLPNVLMRESPSPNGLKFVEWKYRPGQRLQLRVPVEEWEQQIVLSVDGIVQEGAEAYVFIQNGKHYDRIPVQVVYRDQTHVVIKKDGTIFPGDIIAHRGAHQMQMALKNKSGGGVDPHAGHNH